MKNIIFSRAKNFFHRKLTRPIKKQLIEPTKINYRKLKAEERELPDFIIIGAQKSGTTALYSYLAEHPLITFSWKKEPDFFSWNYNKGLRWYQSFFPTKQDRRISEDSYRERYQAGGYVKSGEASVSYLHHPYAAQRIYENKPDTKIIAILRNPVERCYSSYWHSINKDYETLPFMEAIRTEDQRLKHHFDKLKLDPYYSHHDLKNRQYLSIGHYEEHLNRYYKWFSNEQILVLNCEEFFHNNENMWKKVLAFLDTPYYGKIDFSRVGYGKYEEMNEEEQNILIEYYKKISGKYYQFL